ncbi:helix-turn-helix domain-containing protein [Streptomyces sp. N2-109]|uniref:Helix-turn-helix domain-containing protein n=1 Tax=Streptomyces gossypii TaxID=2883101 RepID=A0ABT2JXT7_9ACTN|nr:helix-turn-helix domain-containing protein [Streptomyces gossypii]MCT2592722.1 helix-turn-helix domain-containing protein [Streptomyces gossypii]
MLITSAMAAREARVSPATVRKWVQLGRLTPAGKHGRMLVYRLEDVFAAERSARTSGRGPGRGRGREQGTST